MVAFACILSMLFASFSFFPTAGAALSILYGSKTGTGDCSSWANACSLQTALNAAQPGSEIWVSAGTYLPGPERTATFTLKDGVAVYGGFAGTETLRSERSWNENITLLSGEIGVLNNPSDNSLHVVSATNVTASAVLDGFTITGGNANLTLQDANGGGLTLMNSSPTLANLTFSSNHALTYGGAVYIEKGLPQFSTCSFVDNSSDSSGGAIYYKNAALKLNGGYALRNHASSGGAIFESFANGNVEISNFDFSENYAQSGGALYLDAFSYGPLNTTLTQVTFTGNHSTGGYGGAINIVGARTRITNALFRGNYGVGRGGAIYDYGNTTIAN